MRPIHHFVQIKTGDTERSLTSSQAGPHEQSSRLWTRAQSWRSTVFSSSSCLIGPEFRVAEWWALVALWYSSCERELRRFVFIINLTRTFQRNADFGKRDRGNGQGRFKLSVAAKRGALSEEWTGQKKIKWETVSHWWPHKQLGDGMKSKRCWWAFRKQWPVIIWVVRAFVLKFNRAPAESTSGKNSRVHEPVVAQTHSLFQVLVR